MSTRTTQVLRRILSVFRSEALDRDLDAEIASHIELATEENVERGMTPAEARRAAMLRFGRTTEAKEQHREARGFPWLESLAQDLRFACRAFRRERGFAAVVVLVLSIGVGANVAVFSVVDALMLRPLPFPESQNLAWLTVGNGEAPSRSSPTPSMPTKSSAAKTDRSRT